MQYTIPSLPVAGWQCYQIWFPTGDDWFAILMGMLADLQRGRAWEASTGSIVDVQAVAREIFEKSVPFYDCETGCQEFCMDCEELRECLDDLIRSMGAKEPATWDAGRLAQNQFCLIAHGATAIAEQVRDDLEDELVGGLATIAGLLAIAAGIFAIFSAGLGAPLALALCAAAVGAGAGAIDSAVDEDALDTFKCIVYSSLLATGAINNAAVNAMIDAIEAQWSDNYIARELFLTVVKGSGPDGLKNSVLAYNIEEDDCTECGPELLIPEFFESEVRWIEGDIWEIESTAYTEPCHLSGCQIYSADKNDAFVIEEIISGDQGPPSGCNSNKSARSWARYSDDYVQNTNLSELIDVEIWKVQIWSNNPLLLKIRASEAT